MPTAIDKQQLKQQLSQLKALKSEIEILKRKIAEYKVPAVTDTVIGSDPDFPYAEHPIVITGVDVERYERSKRRLLSIYQHRLIELMELKEKLENTIAEIDDSLTRQVVSLRCINGLPWTKIAYNIGGNNTADSVRMVFNRFFSKL